MGDNNIIDLTHTRAQGQAAAEAAEGGQNQNNDTVTVSYPNRGGRRKHPDWEHVDVPNKKCRYCNNVLSAGKIKIERLAGHLKKCRKYQQYLQTKKAETAEMRVASRTRTSSSSSDIDNANNAMGAAPIKNQGNNKSNIKRRKKTFAQESIDGYVIKTNQEKARRLDSKIANFFYSCNIAFSIADHPAFSEMIEELRPSYKPPSRKLLAGKLLDDMSDQIDKQMTEDLTNDNNNRAITILQDGWSNIKNCPIIATSIHTGKDSYLLSATDCGSEKKTAEYCTQLATDSIELFKANYDKDVFAMVTDNENKMKKLRKNVTEKYPKMLTYGCSSHYLNLLESHSKNSTQTYRRNPNFLEKSPPTRWLATRKKKE